MPDQSSSQGCCNRPVFPLVTQIVSMVVGLVAFILSASAANGCKFIELTIPGVIQNPGFGFSKYYSCPGDVCYAYKCYKYTALDFEVTDDPSLQAAKAMGILAAVIGSLTWLTCMLMLFLKLPACFFKTIGGMYVFCFACQMLTLLALNYDECKGDPLEVSAESGETVLIECSLGEDGIASVCAGVFYLGLGITILVCPAPKKAVVQIPQSVKCGCGDDCCGDNQVETTSQTKDVPSIIAHSAQGEVDASTAMVSGVQAVNSTVTETFNPDGGVTIVEERINPDGSTTTTTTTRPAPDA